MRIQGLTHPPRLSARATAAMPLPLGAAAPITSAPLQPIGSVGRHWQERAATRAGFDLDGWHTERGFEANRQYVWGGYEYYRRMQLAQAPLLWAGMAFGIGPTFAAGLQDLAVLNRRLGAFERRGVVLSPQQRDVLERASALAGGRPLTTVTRYLETKLLEMQQAIFLDQGMQHEAYLGGGMDAIRALAGSRAIDDHAVDAWQQIDTGVRTGDRGALERGNLELLRREQMQTIVDEYDEIRRMSPLVTYLLTAIGRPAIPGSHRPGEVVPVRIGGVTLPIPAIDISRAEDRWHMIEADTWPAFTHLANDRPADYTRMLTTSLEQRIADGNFRHLPNNASIAEITTFLAKALTRR